MSPCSVEACPHCTLPPVKRPRLADQPSPYSAQLGSTLSFATGSDTVKANVKSFIRDIDNDIEDCGNVIAHLENALVAARQAKADAEIFRDAHAALFPPIYSLPVELLTEIFLLTFRKPYDVFSSAKHGPWLLGKVCRHWRRVAWASPSLWTSFSIYTKPHDRNIKAHRRASRPLLVQALQRSPKSRVTFDVKLHKLLKSFLDPLIKAAPDWHEVTLEGSTHDWKPLSVLKKLPSLTSLTVRVQLHYGRNDLPTDNDNPERVLSFFKHAPNLRRLWFSIATASGEDIVPLDVDFPWAQLTHLTVDVSTVVTCQHLLACCPNLHTFVDLRSSPPMHASWVSTQPTPQGITEHSNLQFLSTRSMLLLQHTKCPTITQLSIPASRSSTELQAFVERSSCAVRELKISFGYLPFGTSSMFSLRTLISPLTAIRRLEIEAAGKDKVFIENLEALDLGTTPPLVPNMTSLVLTSVKRMKENIQTALLAFCKSRMNPPPDSGVTPLAKLEIMIGSERHPIMHKDAIPRDFSDDVNLMQRIMSHGGLYDNIDFGEEYDSEMDYFDSEYSDDDDLTWSAMHGFADNPSVDRTPVMGSADFLNELEGLKREGLDVNLSGWIWLRGNLVEVVRYV